MQVGESEGQGPRADPASQLTDGAATLKLLNCLGLSLLTCEMGSQKPLHSIPGAELSHVGQVPGAQRVCGRWGCCPGAHSFAGEADVLAAATMALLPGYTGQGTPVLATGPGGTGAGERSWECTMQCPQGLAMCSCFHVRGAVAGMRASGPGWI